MGVLSRENLANSLPISPGVGKVLQILVENQGRINFQIANDFKGIIGDVKLNHEVLDHWNMTGFPFENAAQINELIASVDNESEASNENETELKTFGHLRSGPMIFHGTFDINQDNVVDMFINPSEWGKVEYIFYRLFSQNKSLT